MTKTRLLPACFALSRSIKPPKTLSKTRKYAADVQRGAARCAAVNQHFDNEQKSHSSGSVTSRFSTTSLRIEGRLRARAEEKRRTTPSCARNVHGFVRANVQAIEAVRDTLSWDEIADVFAKEGLRWANGKPVTGRDLRTIACRIRRMTAGATAVPAAQAMAPVLGNEISPPIASPEPATSPAPSKPLDRSRILGEMIRSSRERKTGS